MSRTIKAKLRAWVTPYGNLTVRDVLDNDVGDGTIAGSLTFTNQDMSKWTEVGVADIKVAVFDSALLTGNAVTALKAQRDHVLANARAKATELEAQINKLLAIGMK